MPTLEIPALERRIKAGKRGRGERERGRDRVRGRDMEVHSFSFDAFHLGIRGIED